MSQKPKEKLNLEDVIKESLIEGSNMSVVKDPKLDGNDELYDNSLSLDVINMKNDQLLEQRLNQKASNFNASELERLCDISGAIFSNNEV